MKGTETEPKALLQQLEEALSGPKIVAVGGGQGLSRVLKASLSYAGRVDAIRDGGGRWWGPAADVAPHLDILSARRYPEVSAGADFLRIRCGSPSSSIASRAPMLPAIPLET